MRDYSKIVGDELVALIAACDRLHAQDYLAPEAQQRLLRYRTWLFEARLRLIQAQTKRPLPKTTAKQLRHQLRVVDRNVKQLIADMENLVTIPGGVADLFTRFDEFRNLVRNYSSTLPGDPVDLPD